MTSIMFSYTSPGDIRIWPRIRLAREYSTTSKVYFDFCETRAQFGSIRFYKIIENGINFYLLEVFAAYLFILIAI
jgi:hypothetical protein